MFNIKYSHYNIKVGSEVLFPRGINADYRNINLLHVDGENGSGKSSTFKAILKLYNFEQIGELEIINLNNNKSVSRFAYLPQESNSLENITVAEYLSTREFYKYYNTFFKWSNYINFHKINWWGEAISKMDSIYLEPLRPFLEKGVNSLNYGRKRYLELLRIPIEYYEVFLLDEPFEGLDGNFLELSLKYIQEKLKNKLLLIVDHLGYYKKLKGFQMEEINYNTNY